MKLLFEHTISALTQKIFTGTLPWKAGWPAAVPAAAFESIGSCEALIAGMPHPPAFVNEGNIAVYQRDTDTVVMPDPLLFTSSKAYYGTLFHEMSHSTSHASRLNRPPLPGPCNIMFTREKAKEEIIAEVSAACLCTAAGMITETLDNHAAFIRSWMAPILFDRVLFRQLTLQAETAASYILAEQ